MTFSNDPQGSRSKLLSRVYQYVTDPERGLATLGREAWPAEQHSIAGEFTIDHTATA